MLFKPIRDFKFYTAKTLKLCTFVAQMSLPLRITIDNRDFSYTILSRLISRDINEIKISLEGQEYILVKDINNEWYAPEAAIHNHKLLKAIIQAIRLRYRI